MYVCVLLCMIKFDSGNPSGLNKTIIASEEHSSER